MVELPHLLYFIILYYNGRHAVKLNLPGGEELHESRESSRLYLSHIDLPFFCYTQTQFEE